MISVWLFFQINALLQAMNGFEALRGAYRNHLNSEEERMVFFLIIIEYYH